MRTGTIIEAMEAAKNGARVRPVGCHWFTEKGFRLVSKNGSEFVPIPGEMRGPWEIDDQPRRWPSIVEAVKHMQETGDWGRPVSEYSPWYSFENYLRVASALFDSGHTDKPGLSAGAITGEWETKPAEAK